MPAIEIRKIRNRVIPRSRTARADRLKPFSLMSVLLHFQLKDYLPVMQYGLTRLLEVNAHLEQQFDLHSEYCQLHTHIHHQPVLQQQNATLLSEFFH